MCVNTMSFSSHTYQPASTLRSLTESRQLLEDARREIVETRERAQLRPSHTFSRLPNFFPRPAELQAVGRALEEEPCFSVLFGASSVGKVIRTFFHSLSFALKFFRRLPSCDSCLRPTSIMSFTSISGLLALRT
jgi:hypothetical protein